MGETFRAMRQTGHELAGVGRAIGAVWRRARTTFSRPYLRAAAGPTCEHTGCTAPATWPCICEPVLCLHHGLEELEAAGAGWAGSP
jgi:hypothetical protein